MPSTKAIGCSIRPVVKANSGTLTAIYLKERGRMTKPTAMVFIFIRTVPGMKVNGKMICNTDTAKKSGQIIHNTKDSIMKERSMDEVFIFGKMARVTTASGTKIELKAKVNISGKMAEHILDNGKIIICMAKEPIHGLMAEGTKDNTKWIRNTAMVFTIGQMEEYTKVIGLMVNSMVRASTSCKLEK